MSSLNITRKSVFPSCRVAEGYPLEIKKCGYSNSRLFKYGNFLLECDTTEGQVLLKRRGNLQGIPLKVSYEHGTIFASVNFSTGDVGGGMFVDYFEHLAKTLNFTLR